MRWIKNKTEKPFSLNGHEKFDRVLRWLTSITLTNHSPIQGHLFSQVHGRHNLGVPIWPEWQSLQLILLKFLLISWHMLCQKTSNKTETTNNYLFRAIILASFMGGTIYRSRFKQRCKLKTIDIIEVFHYFIIFCLKIWKKGNAPQDNNNKHHLKRPRAKR